MCPFLVIDIVTGESWVVSLAAAARVVELDEAEMEWAIVEGDTVSDAPPPSF